jgi:hypothetical protein
MRCVRKQTPSAAAGQVAAEVDNINRASPAHCGNTESPTARGVLLGLVLSMEPEARARRDCPSRRSTASGSRDSLGRATLAPPERGVVDQKGGVFGGLQARVLERKLTVAVAVASGEATVTLWVGFATVPPKMRIASSAADAVRPARGHVLTKQLVSLAPPISESRSRSSSTTQPSTPAPCRRSHRTISCGRTGRCSSSSGVEPTQPMRARWSVRRRRRLKAA